MLPVKSLGSVKNDGNTSLNIIVYGDSGVGKTTFAATAAELGKVLYVDAESGANFINSKYADKIDILKLSNVALLDEVLKPENIKDYKTIVLDSVTEIMKKLVDRAKGSKDKPSLADWGTVINGMENYFRKFRDLDKNIILVALTSEKGDEDMVLKRPSLSGKNLPADIVGIVDICLYLENTPTGRIAYSQPSVKFYAKDRTNTLPEKITQENLNIKFIADSALSKPSPIDEKQLTEMYEIIEKMSMEEKAILNAAKYGGASSLEELSYKGAEKVLVAMRVKLKNFKPLPKPEPVPEVFKSENDNQEIEATDLF